MTAEEYEVLAQRFERAQDRMTAPEMRDVFEACRQEALHKAEVARLSLRDQVLVQLGH